MTVVYTTRFRDYWLFSAVHQARSVVFQSLCVGLSLLFGWSMISGGHCDARAVCAVLGGVAFVLAYVAMLTFQFLFNAAYLFARNNRTVLTEHRVELRAEGLYEETAYNQSLFFWAGIHKIVAAAGYVAIYVTAHSALLVPNGSFSSPAQREEFIRTIAANRKAA